MKTQFNKILITLFLFLSAPLVGAQENTVITNIMAAINNNQLDLAMAIIESVETCPKELATELIKIASKGGEKITEEGGLPALQLLEYCISEKGLDPNIQNPHSGLSPAMVAAWTGQAESLQKISQHENYDPNLQDSYGYTAAMLVFSAAELNAESAQKMIQHKSFDPNLKNHGGWTLAHFASYYMDDPDLMRKILLDLMDKGAFFEAIRTTESDDLPFKEKNVLEFLELKGHGPLASELKNTLRGDSNPETSCTKEQLKNHITLIGLKNLEEDLQTLHECIVCTQKSTLMYKAHPENQYCHGLCGSCHQEYTEHLAENGMSEDLVCPARDCKNPLPVSYLLAPHQMKKAMAKISLENEIPAIDIETVKKLARIRHQKRIAPWPGLVSCHKENCPGHMIKLHPQGNTWFQCPVCQSERFLGNIDQDAATKLALEEGIKKGTHFPCPQCKTLIEKNGGCHHMTCTRCHHEFIVPSGQDFKKHCPNPACKKMVTANSYQETKIEEATCPLCDTNFIWDKAETYKGSK